MDPLYLRLVLVVPDFFVNGFLSTVFTHSPWFSPAIMNLLYTMVYAYTFHGRDVARGAFANCSDLIFALGPALCIPMWVGVLCGKFCVLALQTPQLVDVHTLFSFPPTFGAWFDKRRRSEPTAIYYYPWTFALVMATLFAILAIEIPRVSEQIAPVVIVTGLATLLVFGVVVSIVLAWCHPASRCV